MLPVFIVAVAFFALPAQAQFDSGTDSKLSVESLDYYAGCDSSMSADQCFGSPMVTQDCSKIVVNSYDSCRSKCKCTYNDNYKKCNGGLACIDVATSERNACYGVCITDWS